MTKIEITDLYEKDQKSGRLMKITENEQTKYEYEIWFEYTRNTMVNLREGTLLAVPNFASQPASRPPISSSSILELVSFKPIHYALGENTEGYPGFVMEAARNASFDWISQESKSDEDTTIIRCVALPSGQEIEENEQSNEIVIEHSIPMIGAEVRVLTAEATKCIINQGIDAAKDLVFDIGTWIVNPKPRIPIYVNAEAFIKLHFEVFGFTGVGKSNLASTLVSKMFALGESRFPLKIIFFDLMSEYSTLLIDILVTLPHAYLVALGEKTLNQSVIEYLLGKPQELSRATKDLVKTSLYSKNLGQMKEKFAPQFKTLLTTNKIRLEISGISTVGELIEKYGLNIRTSLTGGAVPRANAFIENMWKFEDENLDPSFITDLSDATQRILDENIPVPATKPAGGLLSLTKKAASQKIPPQKPAKPQISSRVQKLLSGTNIGNTTQTLSNNLKVFQKNLKAELSRQTKQYPPDVPININLIIKDLNDESHSSLYVIQSNDPNEIRRFASKLGDALFDNRRLNGLITPLVSFIFDEADEFIPQNIPRLKDELNSYDLSSKICETIARRGRKFGMGIGLCTQRVAYLKTSVIAQPHTYIISKLPRKGDRTTIQEAFGLSDEMLHQTYKFSPGDWLVMSFDATGLKGVPIPCQAANADERIEKFLNTTLDRNTATQHFEEITSQDSNGTGRLFKESLKPIDDVIIAIQIGKTDAQIMEEFSILKKEVIITRMFLQCSEQAIEKPNLPKPIKMSKPVKQAKQRA